MRTATLICFDDHYAPAASVMLTSLFASNPDTPIDLYAIANGVAEDRRAVIEGVCRSHGRSVRFLRLDESRYRLFSASHHLTQAAYFRLFGPDLIDTPRILYLDVDLIVQTDITPLQRFDLGGHLIAAALDNSPEEGFRERLCLSAADPYVNTGVLVIDAERWRQDDTTARLLDFYMDHQERLRWADQDLLNAYLAGRVQVLPQRWNLLYGDIVQRNIDCPDFDPAAFDGIFHYNTVVKPWHRGSTEPYRALYSRYAEKSPMRMAFVDPEAASSSNPIRRSTRRLARTRTWRRIRKHARRFWNPRAQWVTRRALAPLHGRPTRHLDLPEPSFSVHMVTCHADVDMALWSLKSCTWAMGLSPRVFIHDDGSLRASDVERLRRHVHRCTVIPRSEADLRADAWLRRHPRCRRARREAAFYCSLKLFDPWLYTPYETVLLLDSDVLFFRPPEELLAHARQDTPCFNSDYRNSYSATVPELQRRLGVRLLPGVNAGLVLMPRRVYDLDLAERHFEMSPVPATNRDEQTIYAELLSRAGAERLSRHYQIAGQPIGPDTVSHHFVSDGSRPLFWSEGVRRLVRQRRSVRAPRSARRPAG